MGKYMYGCFTWLSWFQCNMLVNSHHQTYTLQIQNAVLFDDAERFLCTKIDAKRVRQLSATCRDSVNYVLLIVLETITYNDC